MSRSLWKFLTSLKLTVVLLAMAIVVVFFGTVAQVNEGLWQAQHRWFQSFFVWGGPAGASWKIPIFPGGYLVGSALLINLLAAHINRFQWGWKKVGIHLAHFGIVVLLLGGLVTDRIARESRMTLKEGQTKVYSESHRDTEIVFISDFEGGRDEVVSIPGDLVAHRKEITHEKLPFTVKVVKYEGNCEIISRASMTETGGKLTSALATVESQYSSPEGLPVQAERAMENEGRVVVWRAALKAVGQSEKGDLVAKAREIAKQPELAAKLNTELKTRFKTEMLTRFSQGQAAMRLAAERLKSGQPATADAFPPLASNGAGKEALAVPLPMTAEMDKLNLPYAVIELVDNGASKGTWVVSPWLDPQEITAGGRTFRVAFRLERYYQPFSVTLLKTTHEIYPGTATAGNPQGIPKNFQSRVRITNPEKGERREVDIFMNNPLRYGGLTFYQYQMGKDEMSAGQLGTSTFQVVRNPSYLMPYLGCILVGLGLTWQFLYHLVGFIKKRSAPRDELAAVKKAKHRAARSPQPVG